MTTQSGATHAAGARRGGPTAEARTTTQNISLVALLRTLQYPFLVVSAMLVPRVMGPDAYGQFALLVSLLIMATSFVDLGIGDICGRFVPELHVAGDEQRIKALGSRLLGLKIALDAIAVLLLLCVLPVLYGGRYPFSYFILIAAILVVVDLGTVPYYVIFGLNQLGKYALREPLKRLLSPGLTLVAFHYFGLFGAIASTLTVELGLALTYFLWARPHLGFPRLRIDDFGFLAPYLRYGGVFYASWILLALFQKLGNPLIQSATGSHAEVAAFDIANQIFWTAGAFIQGILGAFVPIFTRLLLTGREAKITVWSGVAVKYMTILCVVPIWGFLWLAPDVIPLVLGPAYTGVIPNALVLLPAIILMTFAQIGVVFSAVYKRPGNVLRALCLTLVAFLATAQPLTMAFGSFGCALATLLATVVLVVAVTIPFRDKLLPAIRGGCWSLGPAVALLPLLFLRGNLLLNLALLTGSLGLYVIILFVARIVRFEEIIMFREALRRPTAEAASGLRPVGAEAQ
jgi:O-antigen/teichoic acid export membrane protein